MPQPYAAGVMTHEVDARREAAGSSLHGARGMRIARFPRNPRIRTDYGIEDKSCGVPTGKTPCSWPHLRCDVGLEEGEYK